MERFNDVYSFPLALQRAASAWPDAEAFSCRAEAISLGDFADRVARVAGLLASHGVLRGDRVGVMMPKSIESAIGIHAAMASGGAYVPIDPATPAERLRFILDDCGLAALLVHKRTAGALADQQTEALRLVVGPVDESATQCPVVDWDEASRFDRRLECHPRGNEDDLAYVMYTSGSTGAPKGLMHTHRSGLAYARQSAKLFGLGPGDRLGNHSPLHFDMSTLDYFSGPLYGATTVIIPEEHMRIPVSLGELLERERLTIWYSVPFALIQLLEYGLIEKRDVSSLRWVLFGGEPFSPRYVRRLMDLVPEARFGNVYGPAEVNQCTFYEIPKDLDPDQESLPIGRVWDNTDCRVLDADGNPVEPGESGELLIRSPTMMQGYWSRPELNARVFEDVEEAGGRRVRYFRTGDLVRVAEDGMMTFIGRKDRQVKIRGFRVELDEIEHAAYGCDEISEAAAIVVARPGQPSEVCLAVLPRDGAVVDDMRLRRHLGAQLPSYAVPRAVVVRPEFPRTASHKIDRRALAQSIEQEWS